MEENNPFKHEFVGQTVLHMQGLAALVVLGLAMLMVPRRYAVWPMAIMACCIPPAQRIIMFGANFDLLRMMLIFGWVRLLIRQECAGFVFTLPDSIFAVWSLTNLITMSVQGTTGPLYAFGEMYDALGMYLLFRILVRSWDDVDSLVRGFIWVSIPVMVAFIIESRSGRNMFAFLGGVPAMTMIREGRLRVQGAFAHPILAGCFWATLMPLIVVQALLPGRSKVLPLIGCVTSAVMVILCASSTPIAGVGFGIIAAGFFFLRRWMRLVRWGLLATVISLHLSMQAPVWHLISRIDLSGGSTSYFRFVLIDQTIKHADEWWLMGSARGSAHWGTGLADVTNAYVVQCLHGGLILLALFICIIALGFAQVGRMVRYWDADKLNSYRAWALGVSLFIHVMNFIGVSYFGQINMIWYMTLALITSMNVAMSTQTASARMKPRMTIAAQPAPRRIRPPRPPRNPQINIDPATAPPLGSVGN